MTILTPVHHSVLSAQYQVWSLFDFYVTGREIKITTECYLLRTRACNQRVMTKYFIVNQGYAHDQ